MWKNFDSLRGFGLRLGSGQELHAGVAGGRAVKCDDSNTSGCPNGTGDQAIGKVRIFIAIQVQWTANLVNDPPALRR